MHTRPLQLVVLTLFVMPAAAQVEPGTVDPTFVYPQPETPVPDSTTAVPLPDGWLVIQSLPPTDGGPATLVLTRTDQDGRIDTSYGQQGRLTVPLPQNVNLSTVASRLEDGSILLGGYRPPMDGDQGVAVLARLDLAGRFVPGFGIAGIKILDVTGDLDRVAAVDGDLTAGRLYALLWSRTDDYPYDCQPDQATLLDLGSEAGYPSIVYQRGRNDWTSQSCRTQLTLQNSSEHGMLVGTEHGIFTPQNQALVPIGWRYGPFAVAPAAGAFYSTINGPAIRIQRLGVPPGSGPEYGRLHTAVGFGADITWTRLVVDASRERIYAGLVTDDGRVAIARFLLDGSLDSGWHGGVVAIEGAGRPSVWPANGLATELRVLAVEPDGDVVVVTADGIMQRLKGGDGSDRGWFTAQGPQSPVPEGRYSVPVVVTRIGGATGPVRVDFEVTASTHAIASTCNSDLSARAATAGQDFVATSGSLEWPDGDLSGRTIDVQLLDDDELEPPEFFCVRLTAASGGALIFDNTIVVHIASSDSRANGGPTGPAGGASGGGGMAGAPLLLLLLAGACRRQPLWRGSRRLAVSARSAA